MAKRDRMTAAEAAEALGVAVPTIYAYVSRGLLRSEEGVGDRRKWYRRADVQALLDRKELRGNPTKAVEGALNWGEPILDSAISLITDGELYYRGEPATRLAAESTVEQVAEWIWTGQDSTGAPFGIERLSRFEKHPIVREARSLPPIERFQVVLAVASTRDPSAFDTRPASVTALGARLVRLMAAVASGDFESERPIAEVLQRAWLPKRREAERLLSAALILAADHELNSSAFTVRCAASTGANPYAAVIAGLSALQGPKHGGHCDRVEALFDEAGEADRAQAALMARVRRGESVPGFGQPLYPDGDPRGRLLLQLAKDARPKSDETRLAQELAEAGREVLNAEPTIDFGLVSLCRSLGLPDGSAITLFALGRAIGWIGHVIEQYESDRLIRPRARYTGALPTA
jgi:citrate synthase